MRYLQKIIAICVSAVIVANFFAINAFAFMDADFWKESPTYMILEDGDKSNCAIRCAICKVVFEKEANRIYLLFMLSLNSFTDESLSGIQLEFNSLGKIKLMENGDNKFDSDVYYASLDHKSDKVSKTLYLETTIGIKQGIPEKLNMSVIFTDTEGVNSNTFFVDISPDQTDKESENKTEKDCTTKLKTTKVKTTKIKTTTSKKQKVKTTKTSSDKNDEEVQNDAETIDMTESDIDTDNSTKKIIIVAVSAIGGAIVISAVAYVIKKKYKES